MSQTCSIVKDLVIPPARNLVLDRQIKRRAFLIGNRSLFETPIAEEALWTRVIMDQWPSKIYRIFRIKWPPTTTHRFCKTTSFRRAYWKELASKTIIWVPWRIKILQEVARRKDWQKLGILWPQLTTSKVLEVEPAWWTWRSRRLKSESPCAFPWSIIRMHKTISEIRWKEHPLVSKLGKILRREILWSKMRD